MNRQSHCTPLFLSFWCLVSSLICNSAVSWIHSILFLCSFLYAFHKHLLGTCLMPHAMLHSGNKIETWSLLPRNSLCSRVERHIHRGWKSEVIWKFTPCTIGHKEGNGRGYFWFYVPRVFIHLNLVTAWFLSGELSFSTVYYVSVTMSQSDCLPWPRDLYVIQAGTQIFSMDFASWEIQGWKNRYSSLTPKLPPGPDGRILIPAP